MSLPSDPKQPWPPASAAAADMAAWSAWYAGDTAALAATAGGVITPPAAAGFFDRVVRGFWARRQADVGKPASSTVQPVHAPLASDIAAASADLLFGTMPDLQMPEGDEEGTDGDAAGERLDEILSLTGAQNVLLEAAEGAAALGGVYLRVAWDEAVADYPLLTAIHADHALPEFRMGRLQAVTFWHEVYRDGSVVWRHLERHEDGHILHGLYKGDAAVLGASVSLEALPATEGLAEDMTLPAGLPGKLTCWYVPNVKPNRRDRTSPQGRADIAGCESMLDALDEAWSSLLRDIRIGQARIIVPEDALTPMGRGGRGKGRALDIDREVFTTLDIDPEGAKPEQVEFTIRTAEHLQTAIALVERIVSAAGYSPQTFGIGIEGRAESGTALKLREARTFQTVGRKQGYFAPALAEASEMLLAIDRAVFNGPAAPMRPDVVWPEDRPSLSETASTVAMLAQAEAASIETRVRMVNPEWDEDEVTAEVERISDESSVSAVVPMPLPAEAPVDEAEDEALVNEASADE